MADGDEKIQAGMIGLIILYVIVLAILGAMIYLFVFVFTTATSTKKTILEIKSKIGSIVRNFNDVDQKEYNIDLKQQTDINNLISQR